MFNAWVKDNVADLLIATPLIVVFNVYVDVILLSTPIVVPLEAATIRLPVDEDVVISDTVNPVPVPDHEPSLL